jgi:hypothetical protein
MRKKKQLLMAMLCAFSMLCNSVAAVAQSKDKKQEPKSGAEQGPEAPNTLISAPFNRFTFIQNEFGFRGQVVKDAPYSADAVTETIQTLGDGNRIIQNSSAKIYRDSAGRTRQEQALKAIGPWAVSGEAPIMISIDDPVSGAHYSLDSNTKTAHKMMGLSALALSAAGSAKMNDKMKMKAANGAESGASGATGAGFGVVTSRSANTIVTAPSYVSASTNTVSVSGGGANTIVGVAAGVPMPGPNGIFSWSSEGEVNQESLGKQMIEGVEAEGTRVTITIQAGKIGNERPIVTVNERWYSPELQTVVLSKNSDPRMGETTYKLTNIDRNEPDPALFQVPADYTIQDGPGFGFGPGIPPEPPMRFKIDRRTKKPNEN